MSKAWLSQQERGSLRAMQLLTWLTLKIGRRTGRVFLLPICLYYVIFSRRARRASADFLTRALDRRVGWKDIFRHYHTFASTIHDRIYLLSGQHTHFDVTTHGLDRLETVLKQDKGCILLGSHLGSFEVLRAMGLLDRQLPVNALMHSDHSVKINRVLHALNPAIGERIIPLGRPDTLLRVKEKLDQGEIVGILGDRVFNGDKARPCTFFGGQADFPEGPLLLAGILKTPVVLFFGIYRGGRKYDIYFEVFSEGLQLDRRGRDEALQLTLQRYVERLEYHARRAPYNWFNFYDFWSREVA